MRRDKAIARVEVVEAAKEEILEVPQSLSE